MPSIEQAIDVVRRLGVPIRITNRQISGTFLKGSWIDDGEVVVNPEVVLFGDVFHEAGHLAVTPSKYRKYWRPSTNLEDPYSPLLQAIDEKFDQVADFDEPEVRHLNQMGECEAIAWEYAALVDAGIDPALAFGHKERFEGAGLELVDMLKHGAHFGVHGLHYAGMSTLKLYPRMLKWLQD